MSRRFQLTSQAMTRFVAMLALALAGLLIVLLLQPERGLRGVYSTPGASGHDVVIATRLDPEVDYGTPQWLESPIFQHWNLSLLPVPAALPPFQVRWSGYLKAPIAGPYGFLVESAGLVRLRVDGHPLAPEAGSEAEGVVAPLSTGWHALELIYRRGDEEPGIRLLWRPPGSAAAVVLPGSSLAPSESAIRNRAPRVAAGLFLLAGWLAIGAAIWKGRSRPGSLGGSLVERRHEVALAGAVFLGLILRLHQFDVIPFHHETADEYQHGWEGWTLLHEGQPAAWTFYPQSYPAGRVTPFRWFGDSYYLARPYFDHPPGFSLLVGAVCTALGAERMLDCTLLRMRWVPIFFGVLTILLVGRAGWRFFPDRAGGTLAALLYATLPVIVLGNRIVKAENLLAPLLLAQAFWLEGYLRDGRRGELFKAAAGGAVAIWAKATGLAAPLSALVLLGSRRKGKAAVLIAGAAGAAIALYLAYGAFYGWDQFLTVLGQQASKRVALRTLLDLTGIARIVELQFGTGWYLWLGIAAALMALGRHRVLLLPAAVYLGLMGLTADSRGVFGWYRLPLYPFLCLAGGLFLAEWWREKDPGRGMLFGISALCTSLSYALPPSMEASRPAVLVLLGLVSAGPLWMLWSPSPAAKRVRDASVAAALLLFFAANLLIVANQVPIYLREATRGKVAPVAQSPVP